MKKTLLWLGAAVALLATAAFSATAAPPEQVPRTPQVMQLDNASMHGQKGLFAAAVPDRALPSEQAALLPTKKEPALLQALPTPWGMLRTPAGITKLDVQAGFNPPISIHGGGSGGMLDPRLNENGGGSRWQMAGAGGSSCVTSGIPTPHERMPVSFTT